LDETTLQPKSNDKEGVSFTTKPGLLADIVALPAPQAAPLLLGTRIISRHGGELVSGIITEVEAYTQEDPASHTYRGRTKRNEAMFGPAGHAYIYFTYGMHYCLNIVCGPKGRGEGVLVRGIEITNGIEKAIRRRYSTSEPTLAQLKNISNGPGKVVQALGVSMADYGADLLNEDNLLHLEPGVSVANVRQTKRIGLSRGKDTLWRWHS